MKKDNINILVVDDDPDILLAAVRLLRKAGYHVFEAQNANNCLSILNEEKIDLVLLDVVMPDMDGYEACKKIKAGDNTRQTYVVLLSGMKTSPDDQSEGLEIGADGFIARPVTNRELLARVEAMVRIINAERERDRLIEELQKALNQIRTLEGIIPICMHCHKIRNDQEAWDRLEKYIEENSEARFSHSICPECLEKLYPE